MESESDVFVPEVSPDQLPQEGQRFSSIDEAFEFYNTYAKAGGFSVRHHSSKRRKNTGEVWWKQFTCAKQGKTDLRWQNEKRHQQPTTGERNRPHTRTDCKAQLSISQRLGADTWGVTSFYEQHNHPLSSQEDVHFLRSHRELSEARRCQVEQLSAANVPTWQQIRIMEVETGGPSSMGHLERDVRNAQRDQRLGLMGQDAETFIQYMANERRRDENYFFEYEAFGDGTFRRCFWADSESRNNYAIFGDCLVFDTTYNTNKYGMILAPFVGINHHRQTILFGCGLLSDETTESFEWLFAKFLEAMPTHEAPGLIITDQDQAIGNAVSNVFPSAFHRLCLWHITYKFSEKLGPVLFAMHKGILMNIIHQSETVEEFESRWEILMSSTALGNNEWLQNMYEIRGHWVPAYVKPYFSGGMSSSQRVESHHSFMKRYVNRHHTLMDFITRFDGAIAHQRHEEQYEDHINSSQLPRLRTHFVMEEQMSKEYTKQNFFLFQEELSQSTSYGIRRVKNAPLIKTYEVERQLDGDDHGRRREVSYNKENDFAYCECGMWTCEGIPCRHLLRYLTHRNIYKLPPSYIYRRWTKDAKSSPVFNAPPSFNKQMPIPSRLGAMRAESNNLFDNASLSQISTDYVLNGLRDMKIGVNDLLVTEGVTTSSTKGKCKVTQGDTSVRDPESVRAKGNGKRIKSSKEKSMKQANRVCGICSRPGHDKRKCPDALSAEDNAYRPHLYSQESEEPTAYHTQSYSQNSFQAEPYHPGQTDAYQPPNFFDYDVYGSWE